MMEGISLEQKEGYAILSVDIPQTRNALSVPLVEYMDTLVDSVIADKDIHCLVITGGGEKSFVAGADIAKLVKMSPEESRYSIEVGHKLFSKIETMDIPVVAAINGYCLGGGLSGWADMRAAVFIGITMHDPRKAGVIGEPRLVPLRRVFQGCTSSVHRS